MPTKTASPFTSWFREHAQRVSPMLELKNCRHVRLRGVTFTGCVIRRALRAFQIEMWDAGTIENVMYT